MRQRNKVDAIYELRSAAETKARAEAAVDRLPTPENRDALLDARSTLEEKTMKALDVCHECGHPHGPADPHMPRGGNVIQIDFNKSEETED